MSDTNVQTPRRQYYPEYKAANQQHLDAMYLIFSEASTKEDLQKMTLIFVIDMSYDRQDILVALGRVEREKGWH